MWSAQVESGSSTWANQKRAKNRSIVHRSDQTRTTSINASQTLITGVEQSPRVSIERTCLARRKASSTVQRLQLLISAPVKGARRAPRQGGYHPWKPQQQSASELGLHCWDHNPNLLNSTKIRELTVRLKSNK